MNIGLRIWFLVLMTMALLFGFCHLIAPVGFPYDFERLHIFLFNLCCGATILIYYTENQKTLSFKGRVFLVASLLFGIMAFLKIYSVAIATAFVLFIIVESVRQKRFSFFPRQFFSKRSTVSEKFHHASLLCLSIGLVFSIIAIVNEVYYPFLDLKMVKLNTFFLGFSFPISLITMSVMFAFMNPDNRNESQISRQYSFWAINLGVIIFFIFILLDWPLPQVIISTTLFLSVILILYLFYKYAHSKQQKSFLSSGMYFLLSSAITGILYILYKYYMTYDYETGRIILRTHVFTALYGWNLSGLAIICRFHDFPIRLHSRWVITLHWFTVLILAPIGYQFLPLAALATVSYSVMLYLILLSHGRDRAIT